MQNRLSADAAQGIDLLFEAALDRVPWSGGLDRLSRAFNATGAVIMCEDLETVELGLPVSGAFADLFSTFIAQGWHRNDLRAHRGWPLIAAGSHVLLEHQLSTENERRNEPYYQEFFWRQGLPWFVAVAFNAQGKRWAFCMLRGLEAGPFEPGDAPRLRLLRPHLSRIVTLAHEFRSAAQRGATDLLERARTPVLAIGFDGKVQWSSPAALEAMGAHVSVVKGRLVASDHGQDARLQHLLGIATAARQPSGQVNESAMMFSDGVRPSLVLEISAMPRSGVDAFSRVAAVAFVRRLSEDRLIEPEMLVRLFGLTLAEARVAALIGSGLSGPIVAIRLGVSYETVRTHLARVFQKLSINRQAELVEILANLRWY